MSVLYSDNGVPVLTSSFTADDGEILLNYRHKLDDLKIPTRPTIQMLTEVAAEQRKDLSPHFARMIFDRILARQKLADRLPLIYLMDSIMKYVKQHDFKQEFGPKLAPMLAQIWAAASTEDRRRLNPAFVKLIRTWEDGQLFPAAAIQQFLNIVNEQPALPPKELETIETVLKQIQTMPAPIISVYIQQVRAACFASVEAVKVALAALQNVAKSVAQQTQAQTQAQTTPLLHTPQSMAAPYVNPLLAISPALPLTLPNPNANLNPIPPPLPPSSFNPALASLPVPVPAVAPMLSAMSASSNLPLHAHPNSISISSSSNLPSPYLIQFGSSSVSGGFGESSAVRPQPPSSAAASTAPAVVYPPPPFCFESEVLKAPNTTAIWCLYEGISTKQCKTCGMRMSDANRQAHLDWHFKLNRKNASAATALANANAANAPLHPLQPQAKKASGPNQPWSFTVNEWIQMDDVQLYNSNSEEEIVPFYQTLIKKIQEEEKEKERKRKKKSGLGEGEEGEESEDEEEEGSAFGSLRDGDEMNVEGESKENGGLHSKSKRRRIDGDSGSSASIAAKFSKSSASDRHEMLDSQKRCHICNEEFLSVHNEEKERWEFLNCRMINLDELQRELRNAEQEIRFQLITDNASEGEIQKKVEESNKKNRGKLHVFSLHHGFLVHVNCLKHEIQVQNQKGEAEDREKEEAQAEAQADAQAEADADADADADTIAHSNANADSNLELMQITSEFARSSQ